MWPVLKSVVVSFAFLSTAIVLFKEIHYSRMFLLFFAFFSYIFMIVQRVLVNSYLRRKSKNGFQLHKILIVGSPERSKIVSDIFEKQLSWGHIVLGRISLTAEDDNSSDCIGTLEKLPNVIRYNEVDEVVFAFDGDKSIDLSEYLHLCQKMGVQVRILPSLWKKSNFNLSFEHCQRVPFLTIKSGNISATGLMYKRTMDIVGGLIGALFFLAMYPFVSLAIKLDSKGPVVFKQKRVGRHGRVFNLYKFRSMYLDAEDRKESLIGKNQMNGAMFKIENDPRITKVGKWLRRFSIDEFPQFLNVLKGEMSLGGTRPATSDEVREYMPEHLKRISAKPGITGLWQVSGRNEITEFEKVVELDCQYLDKWRFSDDLKIIAKTFVVVLKRKGAL
jgi:exopolysaccharide biosynthesis polyprenyl glycosylphosphotransferase